MSYRYLVDYVKIVIKHKTPTGREKLMALVILKEASKTNDPRLIGYIDKKILDRLYLLCSKGEGCLAAYDSKVNKTDSADFHYLLRECFTNWSGKYKQTNPNYAKYAKKLLDKKYVPAPSEKFWNYPPNAAVFEDARGDSVIGELPDRVSQMNSNLSVSGMGPSRSPSPNISSNEQDPTEIGELIRDHLPTIQGTEGKDGTSTVEH